MSHPTFTGGPSFTPPGLPGAQPPSTGPGAGLMVGLVAVVLVAIAIGVGALVLFVTSESEIGGPGGTQETGRSAGSAADAGKRAGRGLSTGASMEITLPRRVRSWEQIQATVAGETGPVAADEGGLTISVWRAAEEDPDRPCPTHVPAGDEERHWEQALAWANLYGTGPYRAAGSTWAPQVSGRYTVCGFAETFHSPMGELPALIATTSIEVRTGMQPVGFDRTPTELEPGTYAASGADVFGAPEGTRIEFEVEDYAEHAKVTYVAGTNVPGVRCDRKRRPIRRDVFSDDVLKGALGDFGEPRFAGNLVLTGGSPGRGEFHGQLAVRAQYENQCYGQVAFIARRVPSGAQPLRKELD